MIKSITEFFNKVSKRIGLKRVGLKKAHASALPLSSPRTNAVLAESQEKKNSKGTELSQGNTGIKTLHTPQSHQHRNQEWERRCSETGFRQEVHEAQGLEVVPQLRVLPGWIRRNGVNPLSPCFGQIVMSWGLSQNRKWTQMGDSLKGKKKPSLFLRLTKLE